MTNLRRKFKGKLNQKQNVPYIITGLLGNSLGAVNVPDRNNYVYVRLAGSGVAEVFNNRVQAIFDLPVICGYDPIDPQRFQVLSIQGSTADAVGSSIIYGTGYAPSERYRWMYPGGGQDPLFSELRQLMPLRITPTGLMKFIVHNQVIWNGTEWEIFGGTTETDLASYVPTTAGKCKMVLISIDEAGDIEITAGSEVDITALVPGDIPPPPDGTRYVLGAIRLYTGQTVIQEARTNTDVVDLRFPQIGGTEGYDIQTIEYSDENVSNPPTQEEISTAFDAPYTKGQGFIGLLDDAGLGVREYLCLSDGTKWLLAPFSVARSGLSYETLTRYGYVLEPSELEGLYVAEVSILIEDGLWKMWYRYDFESPAIGYATSPDGKTWTKYGSNPLLEDYWCPYVFKDGSTYYLYVTGLDWNNLDRYSSSDGITWTLDQADVVQVGASGQWDDYALGNCVVWKEDTNDWRMLYEARDSDVGVWKIGYATSSDGLSWSKSGSNPVISETGSVGGPFIYKNGSTFFLWAHRSASGHLPTDLVRYYSTDLVNWTDDGIQLARDGVDEGEGEAVGQVADVHLVVHNGVVYVYFTASPDGSAAPTTDPTNIKLATGKESLIWE